ncbi:MAG: amidohydrolase family protein [Boseongicola sp. SB0673_bin_14]|nr:amidohydrolase family protein [Chloroflexota bacterium]MYI70621.1 amidohydrolase family protein [Boseongicola sp. SB0673_bin_14]
MTARIDSHQHFWRYNSQDYPWIDATRESLKVDYMPPDLLPLMQATGIAGTVAVQARQNLRETEFLLELANEYDFIRGVVGWVDMRADDVEAQLERFAAHPRLVGVRHIVHDEADDRFMLGGNFLRGLAKLKACGLTYDLLLFPRHLPVAIEVVRRFPEQPFVLDHIAKPFIKDGLLEPWERDIRQLAAFDNVFCKVSGMVTEAAWGGWTQDDFRPYLDVVFDCFGIDRLMFGSDWPVCTLAGSYRQVVGIVETYIAALSPDEQTRVMGGAATEFYQLP